MSQAQGDELDQRIRKELGESINPLYVRSLLDMSTPDLLRWLKERLAEEANMMDETIALAERGHDAYRFGLRLHNGHLDLFKFILKELASRHDAIVVADEPPNKLPSG